MGKRSVLITGCNPGGIGNSLARQFHAQGATAPGSEIRVFATARDPEAISDLAALGITTLPLEVTDEESVKALFTTIQELTQGRLDYLVNNAGRNYTVPAADVDIDEVRAVFDVNVFGVMRMCQTFAPLLIEAQGTIVQIGSIAGVIPYAFGSGYNASKAALHSYSDTLRLELEPFNVKVVTIVTGGVKSRIARTVRALPAGSIYAPIEPAYNRRQKHSQEVGMPNEQYAHSVVKQVLASSNRRRIWEGSFSWIVWFSKTFLPEWLMEYRISREFQLSALRKLITTSRTKSVV